MAKKLTKNIYNVSEDDTTQQWRPGADEIRQLHQKDPGPPDGRARVWGWLRPVVITLISLTLVVCGLYYGYGYIRDKYLAPVDPKDNTPITVTIETASSLDTIAQQLYNSGVIRNKNVFELYADFTDISHKLKAGTYRLSKNMTYDDIIYTLMKGKEAIPVIKITLTEGMNVQTMGQTLISKGAVKSDAKYLKLSREGTDFKEYSFIAAILANKSVGRIYALEGYLFPDTYELYTDSDVSVIITKQLDRFDQIFTDEYEAKAAQMNLTIDQVITLASIIEKEGKPQDFAKISAVFHNRLAKEMRLQADATLTYALGIKKYNYSDDQKNIDSPYNTYIIKGIPVGPICNPGKNAIEAALYPDEQYLEEGYLYFTLTDPGSNSLAFSKTLDEHNEIVAKYKQAWIDADNAAAAETVSPAPGTE